MGVVGLAENKANLAPIELETELGNILSKCVLMSLCLAQFRPSLFSIFFTSPPKTIVLAPRGGRGKYDFI